MGFLTPSTSPATSTCRALFIPDDESYLAIVRGALELLTLPHMWDKFGTLTPEQAAAMFDDMFDRFCFNEGNCRMVGEVVLFAGGTSPTAKWLQCDGTSYLRSAYPDLFNVIGVTYGAIDGSHFNVPDFAGRVAVGAGSGSGLSTRTNGDVFGEETHQLGVGELAAHTHSDSGHSHVEGTASPSIGAAITGVPVPSAIPSVGSTGLGFAAISTTGSSSPHNNIQPSLVATYYIVAMD